jgi:YD repeat-containing protein
MKVIIYKTFIKMVNLTFLLNLFFAISGCHKDNVSPSGSPTCRISKLNFTSIDVVLNDTTNHDLVCTYNALGMLIKTSNVYDASNFDAQYYEYDVQGRLIKYIDDLSGGTGAGSDTWRYKYDASGRLMGMIYGYGSDVIKDSSVYEYINPALVKETVYDYQIQDTIISNMESDANGNHIKTYSNQFRKDTMVLKEEFEYYADLIPSSFDIDKTPTAFIDKNLLKKSTQYFYFFSGSVLVSQSVYSESYTYEFDAEGKIIRYIMDSTYGSESKDIVDVIYDCK